MASSPSKCGSGTNDTARERRFITIGFSSKRRLLVVSYAERGEVIRIISARVATTHERKKHEN
ncbi:MAG TPA: BrnT family toxin [bacterium]